MDSPHSYPDSHVLLLTGSVSQESVDLSSSHGKKPHKKKNKRQDSPVVEPVPTESPQVDIVNVDPNVS